MEKKLPFEYACRYIVSNQYEESNLICIEDQSVSSLLDNGANTGRFLTACSDGYDAGIESIIKSDAWDDEDRDALSGLLLNNMLPVLSGGGKVSIRCRLRSDQDEAEWRLIECAFFGDDKYILMLVTDIQDEEATKQLLWETAQDAEAASRAKSAFLANMSHEIRTPMNAIVGISEILLNKDLPQDVIESLNTIQNSGSSLLGIINDILDFSKIETGKFEITEVEYMLPSLLMDISNVISVRLSGKPVYFLMEIDPELPNHFVGDDIRIKQILMNLLGNAVKFTHEGFVKLSVHGHFVAEDNYELCFDVTDSGIGIREEDLGKLFATFSQVDTRKNRGTTGSGLGLSISRNLARLMGGDLTVSSRYGKGSVFSVSIQQKVPRYVPVGEVRDKENIRLLICEPNDILVKNLSKVADNLGLEYEVCREVDRIREFQGMTHVLIRRRNFALVREKLNFIYKREDILLVLDNDELPDSTFMDYKQLQLPLITLQLINALNGDDIVSSMKKKSFDRSQIIPLTFAKVLVVDDNATNLQVAQGLMAPYKMKVDTTTSGFDAIEMTKKTHYDAIFMDHMMPEMDGIEAAGYIRGLEGEYYKNVPIIALTANAMSDARDQFIEAGMNDFVAKPIEMRELHRVIKKYIQSKAPQEYLDMARTMRSGQEAAEKKPVSQPKPVSTGSAASGAAAVTIPLEGGSGGDMAELLRRNNALLEQTSVMLRTLLGDAAPQLDAIRSAEPVQGSAAAESYSAAEAVTSEAQASDDAADAYGMTMTELPDFIPGVDMRESLETYGGDVQIYHNILKTYYFDLCEKEKTLPELYENRDTDNFTIQVHALKSASRSIGAANLGEDAYRLELAGKESDWTTIDENFPGFMDEVRQMRENVERYAKTYLLGPEEDSEDSAEFFDEGLVSQLRDACFQMDYLRAEEILKKLREKTYPDELDKLLDELIKYCESYDYDNLDNIVSAL